MKIVSAEYVISAVKPEQYPGDGWPEIAFAGRSNVGKSSLINKLVNRRALAKTSGSPGKTRTLNFYLINSGFYFVDLPGYGFAKVSKAEQACWSKMIEGYLLNRKQLKAAIQLVDIRHAPSSEDIQMQDWLKHYGIPTILAVTKADKVARGKWPNQVRLIRETLQPLPGTPLVVFSAETGQGREELWGVINGFIS